MSTVSGFRWRRVSASSGERSGSEARQHLAPRSQLPPAQRHAVRGECSIWFKGHIKDSIASLAFHSDYDYVVCYMYIWPFFSCFHRGKCRLLYFYIHISLIDPIFTFYSQPGSGRKPFPDILCDCCCSWEQHNIGNSTSNVEQAPSSVV